MTASAYAPRYGRTGSEYLVLEAITQFDFLVGEWTVDVTSKAAATLPSYKGIWRAAKTLDGLGIVNEYDGGATWVPEYLRIEATRQVSAPASR